MNTRKTTPLKLRRDTSSDVIRVVHWSRALPFFLNPRGLLIHRVESVRSFVIHHRVSHYAVDYLCNGGTTAKGEFLAVPPKNRLVCQACELAAKRKKKPTADELAGRHVHVGKIRAEQTCCREAREQN